MPYTIEVRDPGNDLSVTMSAMRMWLDHHHFEPGAFRQLHLGVGVIFRLEFKREREAVAFANAFGGRLLGSEAKSRAA
jgi:hypothetical protein